MIDLIIISIFFFFFFFQAEDGIRDRTVTGVQTCALPIFEGSIFWQKIDPSTAFLSRSGQREPHPHFYDDAHGRSRVLSPDRLYERCEQIGRASCRERV